MWLNNLFEINMNRKHVRFMFSSYIYLCKGTHMEEYGSDTLCYWNKLEIILKWLCEIKQERRRL